MSKRLPPGFTMRCSRGKRGPWRIYGLPAHCGKPVWIDTFHAIFDATAPWQSRGTRARLSLEPIFRCQVCMLTGFREQFVYEPLPFSHRKYETRVA